MSLETWLAQREDRCECGNHVPTQGCACGDEWHIFVAALRASIRDGEINQTDVRPLIRGRVAPKRIGLYYRRAKTEGLIEPLRKERSSDVAGRNTHHDSPVYAWVTTTNRKAA